MSNRLKTSSNYWFSPSGHFGNFYAIANVKPYGSIWRVPVVTYLSISKGFYYVEKDPVLILANCSGLDDPSIPKRIKMLFTFDDKGDIQSIPREGATGEH